MKAKLNLEKDEDLREKGWSGIVEFEVPKYTDRLKLMKSCNFKIDENGEFDKTSNLDGASVVAEASIKAITKIDAVYNKNNDKLVIDNAGMLEYYSFGADILTTVGNRLMVGIELGEC